MDTYDLSEIHDVLHGLLQPWRKDNCLPDAEYESRINTLREIKLDEEGRYTLKLDVSLLFTHRVRFYKRLIDNAIFHHANAIGRILETDGSEELQSFIMKKNHDAIETHLKDAALRLKKQSVSIKDLTDDETDLWDRRDEKEYAIILHYLIASLVWCMMEIQERYPSPYQDNEPMDVKSCYRLYTGMLPNRVVEVLVHEEENGKTKAKPQYRHCCFHYNTNDHDSFNINIQAFRNKLLHYGLVPQDNDLKDLLGLFGGEKTSVKIKWTGNNSVLASLMKALLNEKKIITVWPKGATIWTVVSNRFVDSNGNPMPNLGKESPRKKETEMVNDLVSAFC